MQITLCTFIENISPNAFNWVENTCYRKEQISMDTHGICKPFIGLYFTGRKMTQLIHLVHLALMQCSKTLSHKLNNKRVLLVPKSFGVLT